MLSYSEVSIYVFFASTAFAAASSYNLSAYMDYLHTFLDKPVEKENHKIP